MKTKRPKFTIRSAPLVFHHIPDLVQRVIAYCEKIKPYELRESADVAGATGVTRDTLFHHSSHPVLRRYKARAPSGHKIVWGNPKTIKAWNEAKEKERS